MSFQDIFKKSFLDLSDASLTLPLDILLIMGMSFLLGLFIFLIYRKTYQGVLYARNFNISLVMISLTTSMIIMTISSNIILSLGMVGALSIVRFRTAIKDPIDIVFMFWAIAVGIACGAKFFPIAILASLLIGLFLMILSRFKSRSEAYLLILHHDPKLRQKIQEEIQEFVHCRLKSEAISQENTEVTFELRLKVDQMNILDQITQLEGVHSAVLINQSGNPTL